MKKESYDDDEIKVNRRRPDRIVVESPFVQRIFDGIDFLRDETKDFMEDVGSELFDDFDKEEFHEEASIQKEKILDQLAELKSTIVDMDDFPEFVNDSTRSVKYALNRDADYVKKAKRRYERLNSDYDLVRSYKSNIRIIELCDKAIDVNKRNWEAYYLKGLALINLEEYEVAIKELTSCIALNEDNLDPWLHIGNANRLNKKYEDAIEVYNHVLEKDENSSKALKGLGYTYFDCGNYQKADEFFRKSCAIEKLDKDSLRIWKECLDHIN